MLCKCTVYYTYLALKQETISTCKYENLWQGFNWESWKQGWYHKLMDQADQFADLGITCIWLPPPTDSVSPQGYMPADLYNLNSKYGSQEDLRR